MFSPQPIDIAFLESHCSALIKLDSLHSDLLMGHTTWASYPTMSRIYKIYDIELSDTSSNSKLVSFSAYPGFLVSSDDFYLTDAGLWVSETTNSIYNRTLYNQVQPQSLLSWIRTAVANRMATSGQEWMTIFSKFNSGT